MTIELTDDEAAAVQLALENLTTTAKQMQRDHRHSRSFWAKQADCAREVMHKIITQEMLATHRK